MTLDYKTPPADVLASREADDYCMALRADLPDTFGHMLRDAAVAHGLAIAKAAYESDLLGVYRYGRDRGWDDATTQTFARHALSILWPSAVVIALAPEGA